MEAEFYMDLKYIVNNNKYSTVKEVIRDELKISSRLYLKLKNANKIFLNRSLYLPYVSNL